MANSEKYIEQAAIEKLHEAIHIQKQCNELTIHLTDSLMWVLHFCQKNNLPLPNLNKIRSIIDKAIQLESTNQPTFYSDKNNRRLDRTESNNGK